MKLPNGQTASREIIRHPGAVAVLALNGDRMLVVDQYRQAMGRTEVEIPAGKLDPGEEPEVAAARELRKKPATQPSRSVICVHSIHHPVSQTRSFTCTLPRSSKPETWHWMKMNFSKYPKSRLRKRIS